MKLDTVPVAEFKPGLIGSLVSVQMIPRVGKDSDELNTSKMKKFVGRLSGYTISENVVVFTLTDLISVACDLRYNRLEVYVHLEARERQQ